IHDFTLSELQRRFVLGENGVEMRLPDENTTLSFDPWEPLEQNLTLLSMLSKLCVAHGFSDSCYRDANTRFSLFTKVHRIVLEGKPYVLERNTTPLALSDITNELLDERLGLIA